MGSAVRTGLSELGRLLAVCLAAVLVTAPLALGVLGLNLAAQVVDRAPIRAHVAQAIAKGDFTTQQADATGRARGADPWNDCAVIYMALDQKGRAIERALAPRWAREDGVCSGLSLLLGGQPTREETYPRYMHGLSAVAAPLAAALPIETARSLMERVSTLAALGLCGLALWRLGGAARRRERQAAIRALFGLGAGVMFLFCFGLGDFGMTFTHFPPAMTLMAYVGLGLAIDLGRQNTVLMLLTHALLGVLIAWFELLSGGLPLAACLVLYMAAGWSRGLADVWPALRRLAVFVTAFVTTFAVKVAVSVAVLGPEVIDNFRSNLSTRVAGGEGADAVTLADTIGALLFHARYVGAGSDALGKVLVVGSVLAMGWGLVVVLRRRLRGDDLSRPLLLAGAFGVIGVWHLLFMPHSHHHAWFMVRTLAGTILPAAMLLAWLYRRRVAALLSGAAALIRG